MRWMDSMAKFMEGKKTIVGVVGAFFLALMQVFKFVPNTAIVDFFVAAFVGLAGYGRLVAKKQILTDIPLEKRSKK